MVSILMDNATGDIALDENNNVIPVDSHFAFKQIIDGLLHCELGSEMMNPFYGFPLAEAIRNSGVQDSEMFIESLIAQSLDPQREKLIERLDYVKAERSGYNMNVSIQITSILKDEISSQTILGEI